MSVMADRIVQFPNRIRLTPVSGQANVYDVERQEGTVTQQGTPLNAETLVHKDQLILGKNIRITPDGATTKRSIQLGDMGYVVTRDGRVIQSQTGGEGMWIQDLVENRGMWLFANWMQMKSGDYLIYENASIFKVEGERGKEILSITSKDFKVNGHLVSRVLKDFGTSLGAPGYGYNFDSQYPAVPNDFRGRITLYVINNSGSVQRFGYARGSYVEIPAYQVLVATVVYSDNAVEQVAYASLANGTGGQYKDRVALTRGIGRTAVRECYLSNTHNRLQRRCA